MPGIFLRLTADAAIVGLALFASAGTLDWTRAWVLLVVLLAVRFSSALAVYQSSPALIRERAQLPLHRDQPVTDRVLLLAVLGTGFVGLSIVAGLDVFHWHLLPRPSRLVAGIGLVLFALGWTVKGLALRANAFATSVLRLQNEREHAVVRTGMYAVVRHPFYVGTVLVFLGQALWLGSYTAVLCSAVPVTLLIARLTLEERMLSRSLPGYDSYMAHVRYRLLPGIW